MGDFLAATERSVLFMGQGGSFYHVPSLCAPLLKMLLVQRTGHVAEDHH